MSDLLYLLRKDWKSDYDQHRMNSEAIEKWAENTTTDIAGKSDTSHSHALEAETATVATSQGTTSDTFTDLTTTGPSVTVTIGASGKALIIVSADANNSTVNKGYYMGWSGAGLSADTSRAFRGTSYVAGHRELRPWAGIVSGLSTGSQTFTAKYAREGGAGTATFQDRRISVMPL